MIAASSVTFGYSKRNIVLNNISVSFRKGETVSILGANGCGKSTLLKIMLGVLKAASGYIYLDDKDINSFKRQELAKFLSYVPQHHNAVFPYTCEDVVLMGRINRGLYRNYTKDDYDIAKEALNELKIYHLLERSYSSLSGGERQLVMVARAMAQQAQYCFMDEPVSSLDFGNQYRLLDAVKSLAKKGITSVITTHHPDHVSYMGGRAVLMQNGGIYMDGAAAEVINENSLYNLYKIKLNGHGKVCGVD